LRREPGAEIVGPGKPGLFTAESGVLSYFEVGFTNSIMMHKLEMIILIIKKICDKMLHEKSIQYWQNENLCPYLFYDDKYWVSYDNKNSIIEKVCA
jgi:hypothetical protein